MSAITSPVGAAVLAGTVVSAGFFTVVSYSAFVSDFGFVFLDLAVVAGAEVSDLDFTVVWDVTEVVAGASVAVVTDVTEVVACVVTGGESVAGAGAVPVGMVETGGTLLATGGAVTLGVIPVTGTPVTAGTFTGVAAVVSCGSACLP